MTCATRIVYDERFARRGFTALRRTWNRYDQFLAVLGASPLRRQIPFMPAPIATENEILEVHAARYLDLVQHMDLTGTGRLDGSTPAWCGMYERAERVVGASLLGADLVASGHAVHAFNPAGGQHHAHHDRGGGFCVFNDVVAAVRRFQRHGFRRIAVLDIDGHHGDGTESLLIGEEVLTVSLHQFGERTYPGTGAATDAGTGHGRGFTLNLPLRRGSGDAGFLGVLADTALPLVRAYGPEVLIVEFGTDGHAADPLLRLRVSTRAYLTAARMVHALAHEVCQGRLLVVGGGGYDPEHVVRCWMLMLGDLAGVGPATVHEAASDWLLEPAPPPEPGADNGSLAAADVARGHVFPIHGLAA
jgi:acetoin utilization protein AcuC